MFKDGRVIGFCTRGFQTHVIIDSLAISTESGYLHLSLK